MNKIATGGRNNVSQKCIKSKEICKLYANNFDISCMENLIFRIFARCSLLSQFYILHATQCKTLEKNCYKESALELAFIGRKIQRVTRKINEFNSRKRKMSTK